MLREIIKRIQMLRDIDRLKNTWECFSITYCTQKIPQLRKIEDLYALDELLKKPSGPKCVCPDKHASSMLHTIATEFT